MQAFEMVGRKILFQWVGQKDVLKCTVNDFRLENEKPTFTLTTVTGRTFKAENGKFAWQDNEEEVERTARKRFTAIQNLEKSYGGLDEEALAKVNEIMGEDMLGSGRKMWQEAKEALIAYRIEKSKKTRQYYNDKDLHVFYDIKNGNNVDNFMTVEEIEDMKKRFAQRDLHRGITELHHLQAFDKDFNLVIDEWYE